MPRGQTTWPAALSGLDGPSDTPARLTLFCLTAGSVVTHQNNETHSLNLSLTDLSRTQSFTHRLLVMRQAMLDHWSLTPSRTVDLNLLCRPCGVGRVKEDFSIIAPRATPSARPVVSTPTQAREPNGRPRCMVHSISLTGSRTTGQVADGRASCRRRHHLRLPRRRRRLFSQAVPYTARPESRSHGCGPRRRHRPRGRRTHDGAAVTQAQAWPTCMLVLNAEYRRPVGAWRLAVSVPPDRRDALKPPRRSPLRDARRAAPAAGRVPCEPPSRIPHRMLRLAAARLNPAARANETG